MIWDGEKKSLSFMDIVINKSDLDGKTMRQVSTTSLQLWSWLGQAKDWQTSRNVIREIALISSHICSSVWKNVQMLKEERVLSRDGRDYFFIFCIWLNNVCTCKADMEKVESKSCRRIVNFLILECVPQLTDFYWQRVETLLGQGVYTQPLTNHWLTTKSYLCKVTPRNPRLAKKKKNSEDIRGCTLPED